MRSVASSAHVMRTRPGTRMIAAAPNGLQASAGFSFDGSHALATRRPSSFSGRLVKSPLRGVTMRQCQSSLTTDTQ
jgi:hypothetical protein